MWNALHGIGSRTGKNVLEGKTIRTNALGIQNFADYFSSDTDGSCFDSKLLGEHSINSSGDDPVSGISENLEVTNQNASRVESEVGALPSEQQDRGKLVAIQSEQGVRGEQVEVANQSEQHVGNELVANQSDGHVGDTLVANQSEQGVRDKQVANQSEQHMGNELVSNQSDGHVGDALVVNQSEQHVGNELVSNQSDGHVGDALVANQSEQHVGNELVSNQSDGHVGDALVANQSEQHVGNGLVANQGDGHVGDALVANQSEQHVGNELVANQGDGHVGNGLRANQNDGHVGDELGSNQSEQDIIGIQVASQSEPSLENKLRIEENEQRDGSKATSHQSEHDVGGKLPTNHHNHHEGSELTAANQSTQNEGNEITANQIERHVGNELAAHQSELVVESKLTTNHDRDELTGYQSKDNSESEIEMLNRSKLAAIQNEVGNELTVNQSEQNLGKEVLTNENEQEGQSISASNQSVHSVGRRILTNERKQSVGSNITANQKGLLLGSELAANQNECHAGDELLTNQSRLHVKSDLILVPDPNKEQQKKDIVVSQHVELENNIKMLNHTVDENASVKVLCLQKDKSLRTDRGRTSLHKGNKSIAGTEMPKCDNTVAKCADIVDIDSDRNVFNADSSERTDVTENISNIEKHIVGHNIVDTANNIERENSDKTKDGSNANHQVAEDNVENAMHTNAEDKSLNLVKLKTIDVNLKKVVDENVTEKNISIMGTGGKLADVTNIGIRPNDVDFRGNDVGTIFHPDPTRLNQRQNGQETYVKTRKRLTYSNAIDASISLPLPSAAEDVQLKMSYNVDGRNAETNREREKIDENLPSDLITGNGHHLSDPVIDDELVVVEDTEEIKRLNKKWMPKSKRSKRRKTSIIVNECVDDMKVTDTLVRSADKDMGSLKKGLFNFQETSKEKKKNGLKKIKGVTQNIAHINDATNFEIESQQKQSQKTESQSLKTEKKTRKYATRRVRGSKKISENSKQDDVDEDKIEQNSESVHKTVRKSAKRRKVDSKLIHSDDEKDIGSNDQTGNRRMKNSSNTGKGLSTRVAKKEQSPELISRKKHSQTKKDLPEETEKKNRKYATRRARGNMKNSDDGKKQVDVDENTIEQNSESVNRTVQKSAKRPKVDSEIIHSDEQEDIGSNDQMGKKKLNNSSNTGTNSVSVVEDCDDMYTTIANDTVNDLINSTSVNVTSPASMGLSTSVAKNEQSPELKSRKKQSQTMKALLEKTEKKTRKFATRRAKGNMKNSDDDKKQVDVDENKIEQNSESVNKTVKKSAKRQKVDSEIIHSDQQEDIGSNDQMGKKKLNNSSNTGTNSVSVVENCDDMYTTIANDTINDLINNTSVNVTSPASMETNGSRTSPVVQKTQKGKRGGKKGLSTRVAKKEQNPELKSQKIQSQTKKDLLEKTENKNRKYATRRARGNMKNSDDNKTQVDVDEDKIEQNSESVNRTVKKSAERQKVDSEIIHSDEQEDIGSNDQMGKKKLNNSSNTGTISLSVVEDCDDMYTTIANDTINDLINNTSVNVTSPASMETNGSRTSPVVQKTKKRKTNAMKGLFRRKGKKKNVSVKTSECEDSDNMYTTIAKDSVTELTDSTNGTGAANDNSKESFVWSQTPLRVRKTCTVYTPTQEATSTVVPRSILRNAQASTPLSSDVRRRSVSTPIRFDLSMPWKSLNRKTLKSSSNVNSTPDNNKQSLMEGTPTMLEDHTQTVLRKKHKKIVIPEEIEGIRRSKRVKVRPLDWFRSERLSYKRIGSSNYEIAGILSPPDRAKMQDKNDAEKGRCDNRRVRRRVAIDTTPRDLSLHEAAPVDCTLVDDDTIPVTNPTTGKDVLVTCISSYESLQYIGPHGNAAEASDPFILTKSLDQKSFSSGFMVLRPLQEKALQRLNHDTLVFNIQRGLLSVTINQTQVILQSGDQFFIPCGSTYRLKNLRNEDSKLSFCQLKSS